MNLDVLKTAPLLTVTSVNTQLSFTLITILSVLVLYPAVFIHTVCSVWFDPQALVLTAAKKGKKQNKQTKKQQKTTTSTRASMNIRFVWDIHIKI